MLNQLDEFFNLGLTGYIRSREAFIDRSNALKVQRELALTPLRSPPVLSNWCPAGYMYTTIKPTLFVPSVPGRINHDRYGNCYIHAACYVDRGQGEYDHTMFLVTLVDAVKVNGYYITAKRRNWYEVPATLMVDGYNFYGFCDTVPCMIDTVDFDPLNKAGSLVTLVYKDTTTKPITMTWSDVTTSKDPNIVLALKNFKFDYKSWVVENNMEHIPIPDSTDDGGDNNNSDNRV